MGWGDRRSASPRALHALAPLPSPSPVKGEGIEEEESVPEIAYVIFERDMEPFAPVVARLAGR